MEQESGVYIEEGLLEVLEETDLLNFRRKLIVELQLSRLEHFDHVTDEELRSYAGISLPAIRRLRQAIAEKRKKSKKGKGIFSTIGKRESREVTKILVPEASDFQKPETSGTCLISRDQITLLERLGEGSFAVVKRGTWKKSDKCKIDVAVKILRDSSAEVIEDLQLEVNNMQKLLHPNLIQLYGIVFANPAMMVVEYCEGGSLLDRLRSTEKPVLLVSMLVEYVQQIVKGMAYLESKNCVHRDLAARNVLLTNNERVVKICDFGLMRILDDNERLYVMSAQKKVPFAWCPPESLRHRRFSHASDVWSFGVTMWELFSYGEEPWAGLRGADVLKKLEAGERLLRPRNCSSELYDLMTQCWAINESSRLRFSLLKSILSDMKFMIAECREASMPNPNVDLVLRINDRVLLIDGSGEIWFGQNIRTRCFGRFYRSSMHVRSDRSMSTSNSLSDECWLNNDMKHISKPIPGSFIHAGHGDINSGMSWGQPDRIDDIYLKNPILRRQEEISVETKQKRFGPEIISSVIGMQSLAVPSVEKPVTNGVPSIGVSTYIDPFAPFSDYSYDIFYETSPGPSTTNINKQADECNVSRSKFPISYDRPPNDLIKELRGQQPKTDEFIGISLTADSKRLSPIPASVGNSNSVNKQFASLPRPARSSSDLRVLPMRNQISTPPPISATDFLNKSITELAAPEISEKSMNTSSRINNTISGADVTKLASVLSSSSIKGNENTLGKFILAPDANNSSTSSFQIVPQPKHDGDGLDPFEVPMQVKNIANRGLYSQLLLNDKSSASLTNLPTLTSVSFRDQYRDRTLTHKNSTPILSGYTTFQQPTLNSHNLPGTSTQSTNYFQNHPSQFPYYWQPKAIQTIGNKPALFYDAQSSSRFENVNNSPRISSIKTISVNDRPSGIDRPSTSSKRSSFISDEVLGMFDPLANYSTLNFNSKEVAGNRTMNETDLMKAVLSGAAFARKEECSQMLRKCGNDVASAIKELKINHLITLGIAKDRSHSITALEDCNWDLNAAAGALIS